MRVSAHDMSNMGYHAGSFRDGALFGLLGIPNSWIERLAMKETILLYAERLCDKASGGNPG